MEDSANLKHITRSICMEVHDIEKTCKKLSTQKSYCPCATSAATWRLPRTHASANSWKCWWRARKNAGQPSEDHWAWACRENQEQDQGTVCEGAAGPGWWYRSGSPTALRSGSSGQSQINLHKMCLCLKKVVWGVIEKLVRSKIKLKCMIKKYSCKESLKVVWK